MKTIEQLIEQRDKLKAKADELNAKNEALNNDIENRKSKEARDKINALELNENEYKELIAFLSKDNKSYVLNMIRNFKADSNKGSELKTEDE